MARVSDGDVLLLRRALDLLSPDLTRIGG